MRKIIAGINMTLDAFCDHTAVIADDELHQHYTDLVDNSGLLLYGRKTYHLMESYWPTIVKNPTGNKQTDSFAVAIDKIPKIVFSRTINTLLWHNTTLKRDIIQEEIQSLRQQEGNDILVGSPSLIVALTQLQLVDEWQFCVHPVVAGSGLPLFKNIEGRIDFTLLKTKTFGSGAVVFYYIRRKVE
jgi:dihydrofolate reductase